MNSLSPSLPLNSVTVGAAGRWTRDPCHADPLLDGDLPQNCSQHMVTMVTGINMALNGASLGVALLLAPPTLWFNYKMIIYFVFKAQYQIAAYLYYILAISDFTIGVNAVFQSLCLVLIILQYDETSPEFRVLLSGCYVISCVAIRSSVFYNVVLTVVRSINFACPFYLVRTRVLKFSVFFYPVFWGLIAGFDIWWWWYGRITTSFFTDTATLEYLFYKQIGGVGVINSIIDFSNTTSNHFTLTIYPLYGLPFVLPSLLAIVSMCVQSHYLLKKNKLWIHMQHDRSTEAKHRSANLTVITITLTFVVCTTTVAVYYSSNCVFNDDLDEHDMKQKYLHGQIVYLLSLTMSLLTSLSTPLILMAMGPPQLRNFVIQKAWVPRILCLARRCRAKHDPRNHDQ